MKFCQTHQTKINEGIKEAGLEGMVAQTQEERTRREKIFFRGKGTLVDFDALIFISNNIFGNVVHYCGIGGLATELCPICEMTLLHKEAHKEHGECECGVDFEDWIPITIKVCREQLDKLMGAGKGNETKH